MSTRTLPHPWRAPGVPGVRRPLSTRSRRLLLADDVEGRYAERDDPDSGYRITMALTLACSQPGRGVDVSRLPPGADLHFDLRRLVGAQAARAQGHAVRGEQADRDAGHKAREFAARHSAITGLPDALEKIAEVRHAVESIT
ncbi:hypothetical protein ABTZ57_42535 [Streptomyces sp. NPDC094048]|uniref:hypothetical protein n=1 Tax=unclassified Streptomyces TaxID=2593676 RepID=UPI003333F796